MPPAAISRSSTYFPKICGNIPNGKRSSLGAALLLSALFGCGPEEAEITRVPLRANDLVSCPIEPRAEYRLALSALGDFRPSASDSADIELDADASFAFSPETRGLEALASGSALAFSGYTDRRTEAGLDVLLWPAGRACALRDPDTARSYPGTAAGQALAHAPEAGIVFVAGEDTTLSGGSQSALRFYTDTGVVELQPAMQPLPTQRAYATATPFGDGFLIAGGENPNSGDSFEDRERWRTAHLYSLERADFTAETIALQWDRTRHAALRLDDGGTLLAGGIAQGGPVLQLEAVYPTSTASSTIGLASLSVGRLEPVLLRLTDGRLLVGGGYLPIGSPVGTLEWFSADATLRLGQHQLPPRAHRVFAALPGGGFVTVACAGSARRDEPCPDGFEGSWVSGDDPPRVSTVEFLEAAGCDREAYPLLVPGGDGAPWLASVAGANAPACLWRFEPWPARYSPPAGTAPEAWPLADALPRFVPRDEQLDPPPDPRVQPLSLGPDSFVWVTNTPGGGLAGARFGAHGRLSHYPFPLVASAAPAAELTPHAPRKLAPDRAVPVDPFDGEAVSHLFVHDPGTGSETLSLAAPAAGEPALTVWITDTLYEDVTLTLTLTTPEGSASDPIAPALRFGSTAVGTAASCPWPAVRGDAAGRATVRAVRRGARVTLQAAGNVDCEVGAGPLALGLFAPGEPGCTERTGCAGTSYVGELLVERD